MKECVHLARLYSRSKQPALLLGGTGTEWKALAESIHNTGLCNKGPFLALSCAGLAWEEQGEMLSGSKGVAFLAEDGTLYLENVETPPLKSQYNLYQLIRYEMGSRNFARIMGFHTRAIASNILTSEDLRNLVFSGGFRQSLYHLLTGLVLQVPLLRGQPKDLEQATRDTVREAYGQHSCYHVVAQGGMQCLKTYLWQGDFLQSETFLKRLILTAEKRSVDEILMRKLLWKLFPSSAPVRMMPDGQGIGGSVACEKERQIRLALTIQGGSRGRVAACLGTSRATL